MEERGGKLKKESGKALPLPKLVSFSFLSPSVLYSLQPSTQCLPYLPNTLFSLSSFLSLLPNHLTFTGGSPRLIQKKKVERRKYTYKFAMTIRPVSPPRIDLQVGRRSATQSRGGSRKDILLLDYEEEMKTLGERKEKRKRGHYRQTRAQHVHPISEWCLLVAPIQK